MEQEQKKSIAPIIIVMMALIIIGLAGYIVYDKVFTNNTSNPESGDVVDKPNQSDKQDVNIKIDKNKDYIHDAEYEYNVSASSYYIWGTTKKYYVKDIVVPYINIDSEDAKNANKEIKEVFDIAIQTFNNGVEEKIEYVEECDYLKYTNGNIVSTIITLGTGATDTIYPNYFAYNFDTNTGKMLSYEEVYKKAGFTKENIDNKVKEAITKEEKETFSSFSPENYPEGTTFDTYNDASYNHYVDSISNNSIKYFLSVEGKLKIVATLEYPAGKGFRDYIIEVN